MPVTKHLIRLLLYNVNHSDPTFSQILGFLHCWVVQHSACSDSRLISVNSNSSHISLHLLDFLNDHIEGYSGYIFKLELPQKDEFFRVFIIQTEITITEFTSSDKVWFPFTLKVSLEMTDANEKESDPQSLQGQVFGVFLMYFLFERKSI